ncbi:MAG: DNA-directed RNA polymerase subunit D [Nitrososphaerota archaeon]
MVKITLLESDEKYAKIILEDIPLAIANALRRNIINEVPTMAIEEILVLENSSAMSDEVLAHRLALIPFISDIDNYVLPEKCDCGSKLGCNKCVVRYTLIKEANEDFLTVYSGDMVPEDPNTKVVPVSKNIPIVKLAPGQKISLELYVRVGIGAKNAKWQSGIATLKNMPSIAIDYKKCDLCKKCIEICAKKILYIKNGKIFFENIYDCTLCKDCIKACPKDPPAISINEVNNSFILYIESFGFLSPFRMFKEAIKVLQQKLEEFEKNIKILKGERNEKIQD